MGPASNISEVKYSAENRSGHEYNTLNNGVLASTTGNVYGVYDMSGGSYDIVASYLDNGNKNLKKYGNSPINSRTANTIIKYFNDSNQLNSIYEAYWSKYEVSTEEKNNSIVIEGEENLNQNSLCNKYNTNEFKAENNEPNPNEKYNKARKRLTDANYEWLANIKGIGVNEITNKHSYYGVQKSNGQYQYLQTEIDTRWNPGEGWNNDAVLIGYGIWPFSLRGSTAFNSVQAGVFNSFLSDGSTSKNTSFRPTICP